jgi:hypothetical protein
MTEPSVMTEQDPPRISTAREDLDDILRGGFEHEANLHRAFSVVKKRSRLRELVIREFQNGSQSLLVGTPLHDFSRVFAGTPRYLRSSSAFLVGHEPDAN